MLITQMIYNEGFVEFAGAKHPKLMGSTPIIEYAEVWDMFIDIIDRGRNHGQATKHEDVQLFLRRHGYLEEIFVTYTFIPLRGPDQTVVGFYHTASETTKANRAERRTRSLLTLGNALALSKTVDAYWKNLIHGFKDKTVRDDFLWALTYSVAKTEEDDGADTQPNDPLNHPTDATRRPRICSLIGATQDRTDIAFPKIDVDNVENLLAQSIIESMKTGDIVLLKRSDGDHVSWLFAGNPEADKEAPDGCDTALLIPIRPITKTETEDQDSFGFLILGLNKGVPYDEDCQKFVGLLNRQVGISAANAIFFEQEARRQRQLVRQLDSTQIRAQASEDRLSRFYKISNIGMWVASLKGELLFANKAWYEQAGISPGTEIDVTEWINFVTEESLKTFTEQWALLTQQGQMVTFECQFKARWESRDPGTGEPIQGSTWFLVSAAPEYGPDGKTINSFCGCNVDISLQKWAQALMNNRLQETLEAKRQTENFIDMVSHEIRNPLSAITQSADSISTVLATATRDLAVIAERGSTNGFNKHMRLDDEDISSIAESASIIITCAQHQKTIVDDILTLSKLDASLLTVTLEEVDPIEIVADALKIHQKQFETAEVEGLSHIDQAYQDLGLKRVRLDRNRVFQVLINLLTNAIKFTRHQSTKNVTLHLTASRSRPEKAEYGVRWLSPRQAAKAVRAEEEEVLEDNEVYVHFAVVDSGVGMNESEMDNLFHRFTQASPRTQVRYGGSGLGLFICKEIVELQGGRIGLSSVPGKGSRFQFFLKAQRVETSKHADLGMRRSSSGMLAPTRSRSDDQIAQTNDTGNRPSMGRRLTPSKRPTPIDDKEPMHVLIVEDNQINQKLLANQLRKAGCIVYTANHGVEALDFLAGTEYASLPNVEKTTPLSVVLMDIEMPIMDGLTCVQTIRSMEEKEEFCLHIPTIAVSGSIR